MPPGIPDGTTAQNVVTAINGAFQKYMSVQGTASVPAIAAATLVKQGAGRVCTVSITVAGAVGAIYDTNSASSTANKIWVIPAAVGLVVVNMPVSLGIVVVPGAAQVVTVTYS